MYIYVCIICIYVYIIHDRTEQILLKSQKSKIKTNRPKIN